MKFNLKNFPHLANYDWNRIHKKTRNYFHIDCIEWDKGFEAELREMLAEAERNLSEKTEYSNELIEKAIASTCKEILGE